MTSSRRDGRSGKRGSGGRQRPRLWTRPAWTDEDAGEEAVALAAACGQTLDEFQEHIVRTTLARHGAEWAASEVGFLVARQNGKGGALEALALWWLFMDVPALTLWTAHEFKTADEAYRRVKALIEASPELSALVVKWDGGGTGQHAIELSKGARLVFLARSKSSGRGFSPRRIIFDEAQELSQLAHRAMTFATSAQPGRQVIFTGTVPSEENDSTVWTSVRDRGRKGGSTRLAWLEWTPPDSENPFAVVDLGDPATWEWSNPALGGRIAYETVEGEWEASAADPLGFARERASIWASIDGGTGQIDMVAWGRCVGPLAALSGSVVVALETARDRSRSVLLVVSGRAEDARPQVWVAKEDAGVEWVPAKVVAVCLEHPEVERLVVDSMGAAASLSSRIRAALDEADLQHIELIEIGGPDYVDACGQVDDAIRSGGLVIADSPVLTDAAKVAARREREGVWTWDRRKGGARMSALIALTIGVWAHQELESYDPLGGIA